ncbi:Cell division protein FtsZ, partial [hydrothermal vent metagenome]
MESNTQDKPISNLFNIMENKIEFRKKKHTSIIKVIGVGGGGGNAVNHMFAQGIEGVDFVVCNTDMQALEASPVPVKIQLGSSGLGAGAIPEVAEKAAMESLDKLKAVMDPETQMVFITAGMGGGTGTGAAPVIAKFAREQGLLSVAIVTLPFHFEGRRKMLKAQQGIAELRNNVDTLLVISNDKLREQYGDLGLGNAFARADDVLTTAAKGIAELITVPGYVNVDFEDVKTVMKDSGKAIMGSAVKSGEDRAYKAIEEAMRSPLLNDNDVSGARNILLYISTGDQQDITMDEITVITDYITDKCGDNETDVIWGRGFDRSMGESLGVTIIATGFDAKEKIDKLFPENGKSIAETEHQENTIQKVNVTGEASSEIDETLTETEPGLKDISELIHKNKTVSDSSKENKKPELGNKIIHTLGENTENEQHTSVKEKAEHGFASEPEPLSLKKIIKEQPSGLKEKTENVELEEDTSKEELNAKLHKASEARKKKLAELSMIRNKPVSEQEKIPAYKRQHVQLSEPNYSTDSQVSRYTLSEDG